jgi:hypothetical protein
MNLFQQTALQSELDPYGISAQCPIRRVPQLLDLTLQEIIRAGRITNPYQLFALARASSFFKNGCKTTDSDLETPIQFDDDCTSVATTNKLMSLSDKEHVQLAQYLLDCFVTGECAFHDESQGLTDWVYYVLRKQD